MPALLSIQSFVSFGHVGHAAALPPLQALGVEVWPVHTVLFSSHPGWPGWAGERVNPRLMSELVAGVEATGAFTRGDALLTGYLGQPDAVEVVLDAHARLLRANPVARFICDPVLGDDGQLYVPAALVELYRHELLPSAQIATPNAFELTTLSALPVHDLATARAACAALGCPAVVATGLRLDELGEQALGVLVWTARRCWLIRAPRAPGELYGTGDVFAALLTAHLLHGRALEVSALAATCALTDLIARTRLLGGRELAIPGHTWALDTHHEAVTIEAIP
jgi:pyridoxine kinase